VQVSEVKERVCPQFGAVHGPSGNIRCKHATGLYRCGHPDITGQFCKLTRLRISTSLGGAKNGSPAALLSAEQMAGFSSSGLTPETLAAAHIFGISTADALGELLNMPWRPDEPAEAFVFPNHDACGLLTGDHRVCIRFVREGHSPWRSPKGRPSRLYLPPGQTDKLKNPSQPLFLVLGEEPALLLAQHGCTVCAASSEWGFHDAASRKDGQDNKFRLHPDFAGVALAGRSVLVAFPNGVTGDAKQQLAQEVLVGMLLGADAQPYIAEDNPLRELLASPDDRDAVDRLIAKAIPGEPAARVKWAKGRSDRILAQVLRHVLQYLSVLSGQDETQAAVARQRVKKAAGPEIYKAACLDLKKQAADEGVPPQEAVAATLAEVGTSPAAPAPAPVPSDPALEADVKEFLARCNIIERLLRDTAALGIVGEEKPRIVVYLVAQSRKLPRPLHLLAVGQSATGKTVVIKMLLRLIDGAQVKIVSVLSAKALCYQSDPLDGKILFLEEQDGGAGAEYSLRLLQSEGQLTVESTVKDDSTGKFTVQTNNVSGRCVTISCTTVVELDPQNQSRLIEVRFDESQAQTDRILRQQRADAARTGRPDNSAILDFWREVDRQLQPCKVVIPFAEHIEFPFDRVRSRRDQLKFLALIEISALLHQAQRQRIGDVVQANTEDYRLACILAPTILPGLFHELPPDEQQIYDWGIGLGLGTTFNLRHAAQALGDASLDRIRKLLNRGVEQGWCMRANPTAKGVAGLYNVVPGFNAHASGLLTPEEVQRRWTDAQAQASATTPEQPPQQAEPAGGEHD